MSQVTLHGFAQSSYVWTARAVCAAKGVDVDFHAMAPPAHKTPEHLKLHPFGKVPAFSHGDVTLYETTAIARYVDAAFDGPALQPSDAQGQAQMEQWISVTNSYFYKQAVLGYIFAYIFPGTEDGSPNKEKIEATIPKLRHSLGVFNDTLGESTWLVGESATLADYLLAPLLLGISRFPEGKALVGEMANVGRYMGLVVANKALMGAAPSA